VTLDEAHREYLDAICAGDRRAAFAVLDRCAEDGHGLRPVYLQVLQPAMHEVGQRWQENRLSVAEEQLATAITQSAMARLYSRHFEGAPGPARTLIAACADFERHELGLRMIADFLELDGWEVVYLGATARVDDLVAMVRTQRPDALALSVSLAPHLPRLGAMIAAVRAALGAEAPLILAGGRPLVERPGLAAELGADLTASDAHEAAELVRAHFASRLPGAR
jgi:MerR family transcriptional regulator, light-induced transcriptional regulator